MWVPGIKPKSSIRATTRCLKRVLIVLSQRPDSFQLVNFHIPRVSETSISSQWTGNEREKKTKSGQYHSALNTHQQILRKHPKATWILESRAHNSYSCCHLTHLGRLTLNWRSVSKKTVLWAFQTVLQACQTVLRACFLGGFSWLLIDIGGPSPLWAIPFQGRWV